MTRILFVGPLWRGSTSHQRMVALMDLGFLVDSIDTSGRTCNSFMSRAIGIGRRIGVDFDLVGANQCMLKRVSHTAYGLIWVEKGLTIRSNTLSYIKDKYPHISIISYSPDDMALSANQSRSYLDSVSLYDWHITHKSFNVSELYALGARRVYYTAKSYDEVSYCPRLLTAEELEKWGSSVSFLGGYERHRFETMLALAQSGIAIRVWGPGWEKAKGKHYNLDIRAGWVQAEDAAKVYNASKINLGFLRKVARDLHTARSVEIPACKAFMLAERTREHLDLFEEGQEAEYFSDVIELRDKLGKYLADDRARQAVAEAGYERCQKSGYSNKKRLGEILGVVTEGPVLGVD